jgi:hypothetical protein
VTRSQKHIWKPLVDRIDIQMQVFQITNPKLWNKGQRYLGYLAALG